MTCRVPHPTWHQLTSSGTEQLHRRSYVASHSGYLTAMCRSNCDQPFHSTLTAAKIGCTY
eukprot:scaffold271827_cov18-Prasinocladus_malaysianus.AAC.1